MAVIPVQQTYKRQVTRADKAQVLSIANQIHSTRSLLTGPWRHRSAELSYNKHFQLYLDTCDVYAVSPNRPERKKSLDIMLIRVPPLTIHRAV